MLRCISISDVNAKVPDIGPYLQGIQEANADGADPPYVGQIVVYDLPNRDCAAESSAGEYLVGEGGDEKYRAYVDGIVEQVNEYSDVNIVMVIEPDSLANLVTNIDVEKCAEAEESYRDGVAYALEQLDLPNVANYVDGGHSGWLGWPDNLEYATLHRPSLNTSSGKIVPMLIYSSARPPNSSLKSMRLPDRPLRRAASP